MSQLGSEFRHGDGRAYEGNKTPDMPPPVDPVGVTRDRQKAIQAAITGAGYCAELVFSQKIDVLVAMSPLEVARVSTLERPPAGWRGRTDDFFPARRSFVFVTEEGRKRIEEQFGKAVAASKIAGSIEDFLKFTSAYHVRLKGEKRLYVPFVNNVALPYHEQAHQFEDCAHADMFQLALVPQFPQEYRDALAKR